MRVLAIILPAKHRAVGALWGAACGLGLQLAGCVALHCMPVLALFGLAFLLFCIPLAETLRRHCGFGWHAPTWLATCVLTQGAVITWSLWLYLHRLEECFAR